MLEQELKVSVDGPFDPALPAGSSEVVAIEELPPLDLRATYYDTPDLRLARYGLTLRHRTGEAEESRWTLKLPTGDSTADGREEVHFDGLGRAVPLAAAELVTAFVRSSELTPVARLRTRRTRWRLRGPDNSEVAELVDDRVSVLQRGRVAERFRELELEGRGLDRSSLERILEGLTSNRVQPADQVPKLVRALGEPATAPPEVPEPPRPRPRDPAAAALRAAVARGVRRIILNDPRTRLGEIEPLHQMRVGTRRLRSDLKTFRPLVDADWANDLRGELRWLGEALGDVRDLDVMLERLHDHGRDFQPELEPLFDALEARREVARERLLGVLRGTRYIELLDRLVEAAAAPRMTARAARPAREVLPPLAARSWKKAARAARGLGGDSPDEHFHEVRKRAKQARYAAEAVGPALPAKRSRRAARFARRAAGVQDVLGELQDAVVAQESIARFVEDNPAHGPSNFAAGRLHERQERARAAAREGLPAAWRRLDRRKHTSWM